MKKNFYVMGSNKMGEPMDQIHTGGMTWDEAVWFRKSKMGEYRWMKIVQS